MALVSRAYVALVGLHEPCPLSTQMVVSTACPICHQLRSSEFNNICSQSTPVWHDVSRGPKQMEVRLRS